MKLYEIDSAILDCVDAETGEIFDVDRFEELQMERDARVESICLWIKNLKAESEALKKEKDAFEKRQKAAENKMESLKKYISSYLDGTPFKSTKCTVSYRKSESIEIDDDTDIPEYFCKVTVDYDKTALKKALKNGVRIEGVHIVTNQNIQIK